MNGERSESGKKCWAVDEAGLFGYTEFFSRLTFFFSSASVARGMREWGEGEQREMKKNSRKEVLFSRGLKKI